MADIHKELYGLIGYPLTHSFSQRFFNDKFAAENIDAEYLNFEIPDVGDLIELLAEYPDLQGLNVTLPYKELVIPYIDVLHPDARDIGAVNVIKINHTPDGDIRLEGYNSDVVGFADSIRPLLTPQRRAALILGSGGASKAVAQALRNLNIKTTVVSRTPSVGQISYNDLTPEIMDEHKIIVNATPLGMYPNVIECPPIPYHLLTPEFLCYDLLYNPDVTTFMRRAKEYGAETKNGLEMLLLQAFESWRIWKS